MHAKAILAYMMIACLTGCGTTSQLTPEAYATIDAVSVATKVKVADAPMAIGSEAALGAMFGIVGGVIAAEQSKANSTNLAGFMRSNGIDIGEIVRNQFVEQLRRHPRYGSRLTDKARYEFILEVPAYGIHKAHTLSTQWLAMVRINYQLRAPDGKVLAADWAMATPLTDRPSFTVDEARANPSLLKQVFEKTSEAVAAKLVGAP